MIIIFSDAFILAFFLLPVASNTCNPLFLFFNSKKGNKEDKYAENQGYKIKDILVINKIKFFLNTSQFPRVIFFWSNRFPRLVGPHAPPRPFIITVRHIYTCILDDKQGSAIKLQHKKSTHTIYHTCTCITVHNSERVILITTRVTGFIKSSPGDTPWMIKTLLTITCLKIYIAN